MRIPSAFAVVVALMLSPLATATGPDQPIAMQFFSIGGVGVLLSWSPVPDADYYLIYRGTSLDNLQLIANTTSNEYLDQGGADTNIYGVSIVQDGAAGPVQPISAGGGRGSCFSTEGFHITVVVANCTRI